MTVRKEREEEGERRDTRSKSVRALGRRDTGGGQGPLTRTANI